MAWTNRENFMRNASLQGHQWIPTCVVISDAYWQRHGREAEDLCLRHPLLFPGFRRGQVDYASIAKQHRHTWTDAWGCRWQAELDGLMGLVLDSPLDDWAKLATYRAPQPPTMSDDERKRLAQARQRNEPTACFMEHGSFFMRLYYLRGFDNFMMDLADDEPRLHELIAMVAEYNERIVSPYVAAGLDVLDAADDLGTQTRSMIGESLFRKWVVPTYKRLFEPVRRAGGHVRLHSDGYIMDIIDAIIDSGVSIVNPQDLVNGVDEIARRCKGRVCVRLDIDRQKILPFGSPRDVRELVKEEVLKLGSPAGGLELIVGVYPPTPPANVEALFAALEEFGTYWAQG